jgi:hypothetical protein
MVKNAHRSPLVSDLPKIAITAFTFIFWLHCVIAAGESDLLEEWIQMKLITASHLECLVVSNAVQHFLIYSLERFLLNLMLNLVLESFPYKKGSLPPTT